MGGSGGLQRHLRGDWKAYSVPASEEARFKLGIDKSAISTKLRFPIRTFPASLRTFVGICIYAGLDAERLSHDPKLRLFGSEKIWERGAAVGKALHSKTWWEHCIPRPLSVHFRSAGKPKRKFRLSGSPS